MLAGQIWRDRSWWLAEVAAAGIHTQGRSRRDVRSMIADALESIIHHRGFKVSVSEVGRTADGRIDVLVEANQASRLAAYVLRYQRSKHGISLARAARAIGQSSKTAVARYEQARTMPTIDKFAELLRAVAPDLALTIAERRR